MSSSRNKKRKSSLTSPTATASASMVITPSVDLTQDTDEEEEVFTIEDSYTKIATCSLLIVGIRYYNGEAHAGEYVTLVREPHNPYDRNAIRVDNMAGEKVGHIKGTQAAILAPFLDQPQGLTWEGTIPRPGNSFNMPWRRTDSL